MNVSVIDTSFTDSDRKHLLQLLNSMTAVEFAKTNLVSMAKGISICRWRDSMGGFSEVSDIMKITGIGNTLADKLCRHILGIEQDEIEPNEGISYKSTNGVVSGCIPRISVDQAQSIRSFVSLDIGQNQVTWCSMFRETAIDGKNTLYINDWNRTQFLETPFVATKHSHATLHEKMVDVVYKQIPAGADCYVTEQKRVRCPTLKFMPLIINQTIAETVLLTLLNAESYNNVSKRHKVYKIRPSAITRLFGLSIGNERVSGHRIVDSVISQGHVENTETNYVQEEFSVEVSSTALARYRQVGDLERESFNLSFLLGIAFYELVLGVADKTPIARSESA